MNINGFSLLDVGANYHEKSILVYGDSNEIVKVPFISVVFKTKNLIVLFDTGPNIDNKDIYHRSPAINVPYFYLKKTVYISIILHSRKNI